MSSLWGVNPTMARIHGLLFITGSELSMDDIMEKLAISRGNVSMNLTKLMEWGIVRRVHRRGDRRDYYESIRDVWEMVQLVTLQRKRREIDPVLSTLRRCREVLVPLKTEQADNPIVQERFRRLDELVTILQALDVLAQKCLQNPEQLRAALELLTRAE
jgi:DNA-binding transcriptional regulator GbsR (MarR family)